MAYRISHIAIVLGVVLTPCGATAQSKQADVARAATLSLTQPTVAQARIPGHRPPTDGDVPLAQERIAERIAGDTTAPKNAWKRGALIGGTALWIGAAVLVGGMCMAASETSDASAICAEVGLAAGLLGGLIGAGIGAIIGSAIPQRMPADTVNSKRGAEAGAFPGSLSP